MPASVLWRVVQWRFTEDRRWTVAAVSNHPDGNWAEALSVARAWIQRGLDDIEQGRLRVKVDPVIVPRSQI
jgi:hypothetical protein